MLLQQLGQQPAQLREQLSRSNSNWSCSDASSAHQEAVLIASDWSYPQATSARVVRLVEQGPRMLCLPRSVMQRRLRHVSRKLGLGRLPRYGTEYSISATT